MFFICIAFYNGSAQTKTKINLQLVACVDDLGSLKMDNLLKNNLWVNQ